MIWQLAQGAFRIGRSLGSFDLIGIHVGAKKTERDFGKIMLQCQLPQDPQRVDFFTRSTPDAPYAKARIGLPSDPHRQFGQCIRFKIFEDAAIAVKA